MTSINYNPDVLLCLANLSNDEVFTPPELANSILDLLPKDIWKNKDAKFLDPVSKSGVFLREITKRLIVGLEDEIPDLQTRVNHILKNQVFGCKNRSKPDNDARVRPDAKTEFNRTVKRCSTGH